MKTQKATGLERVIDVKVIPPSSLEVTFDDGMKRRIDVQPERRGTVFQPLGDPAFFALVRIEGGTVTWPNDADLAPEFLYEAGEEIAT